MKTRTAMPLNYFAACESLNLRKRILLITPENPELHRVRRRQFNSFPSLLRRMAVSRTNLAHNFLVNLGYRWCLSGSSG
ncbi:MAG: hypothetical protein ABSE16_16570 [Verrucomicrobiota bacterium]|jgi:hypothetical protein